MYSSFPFGVGGTHFCWPACSKKSKNGHFFLVMKKNITLQQKLPIIYYYITGLENSVLIESFIISFVTGAAVRRCTVRRPWDSNIFGVIAFGYFPVFYGPMVHCCRCKECGEVCAWCEVCVALSLEYSAWSILMLRRIIHN